jgi:TonB family protein
VICVRPGSPAFLGLLISASLLAQQPTARRATGVIGSVPPSGPEQLASLEQQVALNPADLETRAQLLRLYAAASSQQRDDYRAARLNHIRYLVGEAPASSLAGSPLAYVGSANGPYANSADHTSIASLWFIQANSRFDETRILLNAIRFLSIEDKPQAENLFLGATAARPGATEIISRLGFFYAAGLLGVDTMDGRVLVNWSADMEANWAAHCRSELDRSSNPHVLMGASIALPNLAMRSTGGGPAYEAWVRYSEELRNRASAMDRAAAGAGGMPIEFQMFADESTGASAHAAGPPMGLQAPAPPPSGQIGVAQNVQAANLISSPAPAYPREAVQAGIEGVVRFQARIGPDGRAETIQAISGPPLLVSAALEAVKTWTWRPTILNGAAIAVSTTIEVPFTLPAR